MHLVIRAHQLKTETLSQPITGHFDERGGTIGRSDTNTLALPDPERHISRLQAEVRYANGSFSIRNVGSANAITLNGRPIPPGEGGPLGHGDELAIGAYVMRTLLSDAANEPSTADRTPTDARTVIKASAVESRTNPRIALGTVTKTPARSAAAPTDLSMTAPFADLLGAGGSGGGSGAGAAASSQNPFADLMGTHTTAAHVRISQEPPPPITAAPPRPAVQPAAPAAALAPAPNRLPDDFDPFADLPTPATPSASPQTAAALDAFMGGKRSPDHAAPSAAALPADLGLGELIGQPATASSGPSSLDAMFDLGPAHSAGADPLASFLAPPPSTRGEHPPPAIPADFDHIPELNAAYRPPAVQAPAQPAKPPVVPHTTSPAAHQAHPSAAQPTMRSGPLQALGDDEALHGLRDFEGLGDEDEDDESGDGPQATRPMPLNTIDDLAPRRSKPVLAHVSDATLPSATVQTLRPQARTPARPPAAVASTAAPHPQALLPQAPAATAPVRAVPDGAVVAEAPGTPPTPEALWAAFCQGAGISLKLPQGLTPELMQVLGQVLHHSIDGTLKLVAVRATAKQELRADVTTIQARNNNPLKFSPDAGVAIEQLLQPPMRGFMMGPAAVNDAMDDLLGHAIGTMAGMRAALGGVLERFEPKQLESKLATNSVLDAVLPMNRRAKLWELYLQHFQRIRDDAQDDFHALFGRAFIEAYEEQLDRLDAARHPN